MKRFPDINAVTPDFITVLTADSNEKLSFCEKVCVGDAAVTVKDGTVTLTADKTQVKRIIIEWKIPMPAGCRVLNDAWERGYSDLEWRGYEADRALPWYFAVNNGEITACYGVKTLPDSFCYFICHRGGITLVCDTSNGSNGVVLGGRTITCAEIVCREYDCDAFDAVADFDGVIAQNPVFPEKPVYGYNNWYYAYGHSSYGEILENAAQLARLTKGVENRPYMVVDDCWQIKHWVCTGGYNGGPWRESNADFPDMKALAKEIADMDVIPGIWMRPLQNADDSLPDEFYTFKEEYLLDPTYPGVLEYIAEDIKTLIGWGYKLIKHDFSTNDILGAWGPQFKAEPCRYAHTFYDRSLTNAEIIKKVYKAIYDAVDGKAIIIGCNCVAHLGTGYFHIHRSGDDTSGRAWVRTRDLGVNTLGFRAHQQGKFFFVDGDCAGLTEKIDFEQNKEWLRLLALSGTPLFVSVGPTTLNEEQEQYLSEMLKEASKERTVAKPLDWFTDKFPMEWEIDGRKETFNWYK